MLDALRRGANSWVLKPLFLLLVLAFVAWGVADVFTGARNTTLATVGSTEITADEYTATYGAVMNNFARRFGRRPTAEEARLRGINRAVLEDMVNGAVLDTQVRNLGMSLPQSAIASAIENDQNFQSPDGRFERAAFDNYLREIGYNERGYLNLRRREELREQLTTSLFQQMPAPSAISTLIYNWREETRTIQHFTIDPAKHVKLGEPTEEQLKEIYTAQQRLFVTPEYRHIGVVVLSADDIKKNVEISEDELRKIYDEDKAGREVPERRQVQQIPFKDKAAAEAAAKAIAAGKPFLDAAKEAGATEKDINLGLVTRGEMLDQQIATAAFALAKDAVSAPVSGRFTTVLLRVTEIQPGRTRSFDDMKTELRDRLASARSGDSIRRILDAVDDGRARGKTLKEIASDTKLTYFDVPQADRQGRKADGTPAYTGPDLQPVLKTAFEGRPGIELEPVELSQGGFAWVDVIGVEEEKQRPFEDVKSEVTKAWQQVETARQISELAGKLIERAEKGEALTVIAKDMGTKLATSKPFKRLGQQEGLPGAAIQRAFGMALGARASVAIGDDGQRMVFRLVEITKPAPPTPEQLNAIADQLRSELQQDAVQAYVVSLRDRYGVRIYEDAFKRASGESTDTPR